MYKTLGIGNNHLKYTVNDKRIMKIGCFESRKFEVFNVSFYIKKLMSPRINGFISNRLWDINTQMYLVIRNIVLYKLLFN